MKALPFLRIFKRLRRPIVNLKRRKTSTVPDPRSSRKSSPGGSSPSRDAKKSLAKESVSVSHKSPCTHTKKRLHRFSFHASSSSTPSLVSFCAVWRLKIFRTARTSSRTTKQPKDTPPSPDGIHSSEKVATEPTQTQCQPPKKELDEKQMQELNRLRKHYEFLKQQQLHLQESARILLELLHGPGACFISFLEGPC
ncbi:hypothetical protein K435DRAFT_461288 [Dendrothele bispora CBS 962.96]|uniref:Uncharacterized protein n=1 Tax=Dendrothele bispora (strain CBS 962.96) TaxID=1314807 RepID=A0A4S8MCM4_DENBC|nr:hypothetical protein K435DRAFT_461288 [Dendrothele bispora CBS 962.96]